MHQHDTMIADEHRALGEKIGAICALIEAKPQDKGRIVGLMQELMDLARLHFRHEEELSVREYGARRDLHRTDHAYLVDSLRAFVEATDHSAAPIGPDVGGNLRSWLSLHLRKFDGE